MTYIIKPVEVVCKDDLGEYTSEVYALVVGGEVIDHSYSSEYLFNIALDMGADYYEILITRELAE